MAADLELGDSRVEFMADYLLKTMKIKADKWTKMYSVDENKQMFMDFYDKPEIPCLLVVANAAGGLTVQLEWPTQLKTKACYFIKKGREAVGKDLALRNALHYGDLSYAPMDQLSAFVDEVCNLDQSYRSSLSSYL